MKAKSVFLDTSFLIASQVTQHEFLKRTIEIRTQLSREGVKLLTSSLVFDEFWYVLVGLGRQSLRSLNKTTLFNQVKEATEAILSFENLTLLNPDLTEKELISTLDLMQEYKLRPRDAMIVQIMKKEKIRHIASFDTDFDKIRGLYRIH